MPLSSVRIGWIGTGVMGRWMCEHVMTKTKCPMTVCSRTLAKTEPLRQLGAVIVGSPREVAERSDIVFTIVGYPADVKHVLLEGGVLEALGDQPKNGIRKIVVDCTSSSPSLAKEIFEKGLCLGVDCLDSPVSGGDVGAKNGTLSMMIGGSEDAFNDALPFLNCMSKVVTLCGPAGSGQHTKLVNQTLIAGTMIGMCEALLYAQRAGLDLEKTLSAVGGGAAASWSLLNLAPRILKRNFDPGFFVDHFVKDLGIAIDEADRMGLTLQGLNLARSMYVRLQEMGHGKLGTQSLALVLEDINKPL